MRVSPDGNCPGQGPGFKQAIALTQSRGPVDDLVPTC
jgi:hypothetical protein